ncbi:MAG: EI24 domain-containing protein [Novosphingobium sp.]|nr:EI24 domain-containing protein [Novosphingobium sp.]
MVRAFALALGQLGDRRILAILGKSVAITLAVFAVLGWLGWVALGWALKDYSAAGLETLRAFLAAVLTVLAAWLLFRLVALAVLQLFGDEVVRAVETRHYPAAAAAARPLGWREELRVASRSLLRALGYNLAALPVALLLLATAIGPALLYAAVNAVLLGRELGEMVALRHRDAAGNAPLPGFAPRTALGAIVVVLLAIPFVNLLAPVLGAAAATHLVHRRRAA